MQKLVLLSAITCVLCACTPKEEACDMTGQRYSKMAREGTPLTPKDQACAQAAMLKGLSDYKKRLDADREKQKADAKARSDKPTN